ncbi:MAG: TIGR01244 family sulfur transferase [Hyphomicrobium sp.]
MTDRKLTDDVTVSPQISAADVQALADQGFKSIICNRPDGESPGQPGHGEIEAAAAAAGLAFVNQPIVSGHMSPADADAFRAALDTLPKPILAYCRSGTRCAMLWSLAEAGQRPIEDILARTGDAGYDMTPILPAMRARGGT